MGGASSQRSLPTNPTTGRWYNLREQNGSCRQCRPSYPREMVRIRAQRLIVGCVAGRLEDSFSCSVRNQRLLHPSQIHAGTKERERVHFFHFTPAIPKGKGIDRHEQPEKHDDGFLMAFALCVQLLIPADEGRKPRAKVSSTDVFPPHTKKERKKKEKTLQLRIDVWWVGH